MNGPGHFGLSAAGMDLSAEHVGTLTRIYDDNADGVLDAAERQAQVDDKVLVIAGVVGNGTGILPKWASPGPRCVNPKASSRPWPQKPRPRPSEVDGPTLAQRALADLLAFIRESDAINDPRDRWTGAMRQGTAGVGSGQRFPLTPTSAMNAVAHRLAWPMCLHRPRARTERRTYGQYLLKFGEPLATRTNFV